MSSPVNLSSFPTELLEENWGPIALVTFENLKTWTRVGDIPWRLEWRHALEHARTFYNAIRNEQGAKTQKGACVVAALVVPYQKREGDESRRPEGKSMIFISTIPRGFSQVSPITRLLGPRGGHEEWRKYCHWENEDTMRSGTPATEIHAEDTARRSSIG